MCFLNMFFKVVNYNIRRFNTYIGIMKNLIGTC